MTIEIVTCDACGAKNRVDIDKDGMRCGRCKNPLLDAIETQFPSKTKPEGIELNDLFASLFGFGKGGNK